MGSENKKKNKPNKCVFFSFLKSRNSVCARFLASNRKPNQTKCAKTMSFLFFKYKITLFSLNTYECVYIFYFHTLYSHARTAMTELNLPKNPSPLCKGQSNNINIPSIAAACRQHGQRQPEPSPTSPRLRQHGLTTWI